MPCQSSTRATCARIVFFNSAKKQSGLCSEIGKPLIHSVAKAIAIDSLSFRGRVLSSPDGRFALAFSLAQPFEGWKAVDGTFDFMREHYFVDSENWEQALTNYVVELETNRVLGETGCNYIGTRDGFNHRTCQTVWSRNNRFMVQHFHGKWHTIKATIVRIDQKKGDLEAIDLIEPITKYASEFLQRTKDRAFRKFGFERFAVSLSCEKVSDTGFLSFRVFGEIPKLGDEDGTFSIIQRFRILEDPGGVSLKFLDSQHGPRLSYA